MASRRSSTPAFYAKRTSAGKPKPNGSAAPKPPREKMNKTEQRFAQRLDAQLADGHIHWWAFEFLSVKLADDTHYRPDFLVQRPDGTLWLYEVKAAKGRDYMTTPDAWVKLKIAAKELPIPLTVVWQTKDHHWHEERLN
jgi:hypothetical protein